ncbi:hypothetical protein JNW88_08405 [Micromonospora sp. ATA32]|nr:hypothetical protein [Micromonospora sp. ATA32]
MRRSASSSARRLAIVVAVVFGLNVAVPADVVRPGGEFPLTWLTWFAQRPAWSATAAFLGLPVEQKGRPTKVDPHVPASATDARQGAGRAPEAGRRHAGVVPAAPDRGDAGDHRRGRAGLRQPDQQAGRRPVERPLGRVRQRRRLVHQADLQPPGQLPGE